MSNSRLRNPLLSLAQTAYDLIEYLKKLGLAEFEDIIKPAAKAYISPTESYFWYWFYPRTRTPYLKNMINKLNPVEKNHDETEISQDDPVNQNAVIEKMNEIIVIEKGGWESTSFNTNAVLALLKKMPEYDSDVVLTLSEINVLKDELIKTLPQHVQIEAKKDEEIEKIKTINQQSLEIENELLTREEQFLQKGDEASLNQNSILDLEASLLSSGLDTEKIENEKLLKMQELEVLQTEYQQLKIAKFKYDKENRLLLESLRKEKEKHVQEIAVINKTIELWNPKFNIEVFNSTEDNMEEAKIYGEEAFKIYILDKQNMLQRKMEAKIKIENEKLQKHKEAAELKTMLQQLDSEKSKLEEEKKIQSTSLENEKKECMKEYETVNNKVKIWNPECKIDLLGQNKSTFILTEKDLIEARKHGETAGQDYLWDKNLPQRKKETIITTRGNIAKMQQVLMGLPENEMAEKEKVKKMKVEEIKKDCGVTVTKDENKKQFLEKHLASMLSSQPVKNGSQLKKLRAPIDIPKQSQVKNRDDQKPINPCLPFDRTKVSTKLNSANEVFRQNAERLKAVYNPDRQPVGMYKKNNVKPAPMAENQAEQCLDAQQTNSNPSLLQMNTIFKHLASRICLPDLPATPQYDERPPPGNGV